MSINIGPIQWATVTLTPGTGSAMADGDVLADTQAMTDFFNPFNQSVIVQSVHVVDKADQGGALDIVFQKGNNALGTENAAVDLTAAEAEDVTGIVEVAASDYVNLVNAMYAIPQFNPFVIRWTGSDRSLYIGAISRDSKTYTASSIIVQVGYVSNAQS